MIEKRSPEKVRDQSGVYEREGTWYMRLDDKCDGVEIPRDMADIMKAALWMEKYRGVVPAIGKSLTDINCHQTALFSIGLLDAEGMHPRYSYDAALFRGREYKELESEEALTQYLREKLGNKLGIVQVAEKIYASRQNSLATVPDHSFLAGFDALGRIVCFDKRGVQLPFRIAPLRDEYKSFVRHLWAASPVDEIQESEAAQRAKNVTNFFRD